VRGGYIGAIDLGASNVRVAIADADGNIEARRHFPTPSGPVEDAIAKIARTLDELARGVWVGARVDAVGIALPGMVDPGAGLVASVANLPGWDNVPLATLLGGERRIPVAMENDANAAAVGEGWLGAARGMRDYAFIAIGTGIGSGLVLGGRIHHGASFLGGEVAFFSMTREQVRAGGWDNNLESLVGGRAIESQSRRLFGAGAKAAELFDAARSGQADALTAITEIQEYLAMAVVDIIALLDPEAVVFGGGVVAAQGASLLGPVFELVHRNTPRKTRLLVSSLGEDAQLIGAVKLAIDKEGIVQTSA
jgi:glucokinase